VRLGADHALSGNLTVVPGDMRAVNSTKFLCVMLWLGVDHASSGNLTVVPGDMRAASSAMRLCVMMCAGINHATSDNLIVVPGDVRAASSARIILRDAVGESRSCHERQSDSVPGCELRARRELCTPSVIP
jgi:hypothetical protein